MSYTLVFSSPYSRHRIVEILFIPCPVWHWGEGKKFNIHPDNPHYTQGDLARFFKKSRFNTSLQSQPEHRPRRSRQRASQ
ncbi:MAG: hypothetical protein ACQKBY_00455 [Verrucomicrobiales bacterium]